jgi:hypothetical protein
MPPHFILLTLAKKRHERSNNSKAGDQIVVDYGDKWTGARFLTINTSRPISITKALKHLLTDLFLLTASF